MRRATGIIDIINNIIDDFYPRSPCGERLLEIPLPCLVIHNFYPRSPCGERPGKVKVVEPGFVFLSTLSLRRATDTSSLMQCQVKFLSTLSLRRATANSQKERQGQHDFYPRSPCGERQCLGLLGWLRTFISIHALLAESDLGNVAAGSRTLNFYPRSPCGERHTHPVSILV